MSVVSNIHTATVYDAKKSKAYDGQRLVVTIAKKDANGNYGPHLQQTQCTSIPVLTTSDIDWSNGDVREACIDYFLTVQNAIISERIKSGQKSVQTVDLEQNAIIAYLNSESVGDKWTAERVASWFEDNCATGIYNALSEKGLDEVEIGKKLQKAMDRFSEAMSSRAKIKEAIKVECNTILKFAEDKSSAAYNKFWDKLNKVEEKVTIEDSLGDLG